MNGKLKKALPLMGALVFLMVGAALAVPSINVNLQNLGSGNKQFSSTLNVTAHVNFHLSPDGSQVTGVKVYLTGADVQSGATVYVHLLDSNGNTLATGHGTVDQDTNNNYYVDITSFDGNTNVSISQLDSVEVIYQGQEITS